MNLHVMEMRIEKLYHGSDEECDYGEVVTKNDFYM